MKILKRLKWKFDYAKTMQRLVDMPFLEAWEWAGIALDDETASLHEMDGDEAAYEELSNWY